MNVRQLIVEVKQRRPLWDRGHELRHERSLIEALWDEVAIVLGQSHKIVKNKWKTLKDTFRKEAKKTINDPSYSPPWAYYNNLSFLFDQLGIEGSSDTLHDQNSSSSAIDHDSKIEFVYEDIQLPMENGDLSNAPRTNKRKFEEVNTSDILEGGEYLPKNETGLEDEDLCFFKSLIPHVKQLSPQKKMLMRIKIQEMIYKEVYSNDLT